MKIKPEKTTKQIVVLQARKALITFGASQFELHWSRVSSEKTGVKDAKET